VPFCSISANEKWLMTTAQGAHRLRVEQRFEDCSPKTPKRPEDSNDGIQSGKRAKERSALLQRLA
jgi:hypothetical protein